MAIKDYTAQDMRMTAEEFFPTDDDVYGELVVANVDYSVHVNNRGTATVREMLLQAAEMRERAEAVIEKAKKTNETQKSFGCQSCVDNYIKDINYIIRGDAEEGKSKND